MLITHICPRRSTAPARTANKELLMLAFAEIVDTAETARQQDVDLYGEQSAPTIRPWSFRRGIWDRHDSRVEKLGIPCTRTGDRKPFAEDEAGDPYQPAHGREPSYALGNLDARDRSAIQPAGRLSGFDG
jgi:hypothetical protein